MARKYRSRLAKKESKRMVRQSIFLFVLTGLVVAGIFIWGIPALVRVAGFWGELRASNQPITSDDNIPPIAPQLLVGYESTPSAKIDLPGYAEPESRVILYTDESEINQTETNEQGEFVFESIQLVNGENTFYTKAVDQGGNESVHSRTVTIELDDSPPDLSIESPQNDQEFFDDSKPTIEITGSVDEKAEVLVNDRISFLRSDNTFSQSYRLSEGENQLTISATDEAGNQTVETLTVTYSP